MDHQIQYPGNMAEGTLMPQNDAVKLTPELIDSFEAYMKNKGMDQGSIKSYRQAVEMLYQWLPEEKVMDRDTLRQWSENLQKESYAVRTVNRFLSVGNTLADFLGHGISDQDPDGGCGRGAAGADAQRIFAYAADGKGVEERAGLFFDKGIC